MHRRSVRIIFCCLFVCLFVCRAGIRAQIVVHPDVKVAELMEKQRSLAAQLTEKSMGYRVQIFFSSGVNSREQANHVKNDFSSKYPQVNAYVIFKEPNFQVRVGDFRTRAEAVGFQKEIELLFPQSFVVKDDISYVKHIYKKE